MDKSKWIRGSARVIGEIAPGFAASRVVRALMHPRRLQPRDWERPASEVAHRVQFRSGLSGLRWGDRGPIVLALHGWEGRATQFRYMAEAIVRTGRTLIALDGPAHGASPGHVAHPRLFADALMDVAAEITAEAGTLETVVGHSMGAAATAYALSQGLSAERAVLIAGPSSYEAVVRGAATFAGLGRRATRRVLRLVQDRIGIAPEALDVARHSGSVDIPVLVLHDRDDAVVPFRNAQRYMKYLRDARLMETTGLGHSRILTDADTVLRIAGFIAHTGVAVELPKVA